MISTSSTISELDWPTRSLQQLPNIEVGSVCIVHAPLWTNGSSVLTDSQRLTAIELLSDIQWDKFERRKPGAAKESYLAGRYFLMHLLEHFSGQAAESITLAYNRLNKPFLQPNPTALEFNFTDTRIDQDGDTNIVGLFAFCMDTHVGIDIEANNRGAQSQAIANRRFSATELAYLNAMPNPSTDSELADHAQRFLQIWTRKEAYGKACGLGINFKMNQLNLLTENSHQHVFKNEGEAWRLFQFSTPNDSIACVVYAGEQAKQIRGFQIDTAFS